MSLGENVYNIEHTENFIIEKFLTTDMVEEEDEEIEINVYVINDVFIKKNTFEESQEYENFAIDELQDIYECMEDGDKKDRLEEYIRNLDETKVGKKI